MLLEWQPGGIPSKLWIVLENFILNLSDHELTVAEKLVLSKGLTFIPTAHDLTNFEILSDFDMFANKLHKLINPPHINPATDAQCADKTITLRNPAHAPTKQ